MYKSSREPKPRIAKKTQHSTLERVFLRKKKKMIFFSLPSRILGETSLIMPTLRFHFLIFFCSLFLLPATLLSEQVSFSETDFSPQNLRKDAAFFANPEFSKLKKMPVSSFKNIQNPLLKDVAAQMLDRSYPYEFRVQEYEAYEPIDALSQRMHTSGYNQFENPTGIYFTEGEKAVLFVDKNAGNKLTLRIHDFGEAGTDAEYPLNEGVNVFTVKHSGLGYIKYFTPDFEKAPKLTVHIPTGKVNGYFDVTKHDNKKWKSLLENAACDILDIKGKRTQLAYAVASLKKHCPEKGKELIEIYDKMMAVEQQMMGLHKYKELPKNRIFGRVIWRGFMHADGMGAAFHDNTMGSVANPDSVKKEAWGICHEFGHVNQVRPGMKWVSTTEVTNNIYSAWVQYLLTPNNLRLEHENCPSPAGHVKGGRFNWYLHSALIAKEQWLCQKGPDKMEGYEQGGDHFVKLCPLWQLQLYFGAAKKGNPELYAELFKIARDTSGEKNVSNGEWQLRFMKNACDVARQDLTDFFVATGMLVPIDKDMDDYSRAQLTITQQDCDKLIRYAKKYKKPLSPVIYYINGNCVEAFKNKLPVVGTFNQGITDKDKNKIVSHSVWKNATVFETYEGKKLIHVVIVGTNSPDNTSTQVPYPDGATRIEAVSWDGKRTLVTGSRPE